MILFVFLIPQTTLMKDDFSIWQFKFVNHFVLAARAPVSCEKSKMLGCVVSFSFFYVRCPLISNLCLPLTCTRREENFRQEKTRVKSACFACFTRPKDQGKDCKDKSRTGAPPSHCKSGLVRIDAQISQKGGKGKEKNEITSCLSTNAQLYQPTSSFLFIFSLSFAIQSQP